MIYYVSGLKLTVLFHWVMFRLQNRDFHARNRRRFRKMRLGVPLLGNVGNDSARATVEGAETAECGLSGDQLPVGVKVVCGKTKALPESE